jgi:uncharacterized protein (TIGR03435 family)
MRIFVGFFATVAFAQTATPAFEVASIRATDQTKGKETIEHVPGSLIAHYARMKALIKWAYNVQEYQVAGPGWLEEARFDVSAKTSTPAPEVDLRLMLQTLLADRFKLSSHRETKELPALVMTVPKTGHKLQAPGSGDQAFDTGKLRLTATDAPLSQLTDFLSRELRMPIVDQTGLTGRFNYTLDINKYVTEEMQRGPGPPPEAPNIIARAFQEQLGLKLESKKTPIEMIIVDHIEKAPTEN